MAPVDRKTVGYVRVSTEDQAREGVSLAAQEARIRALALATDRDLSEIVVDEGESAKSLSRPGLQQILGAVRAGTVKAIVVLTLMPISCAASRSCAVARIAFPSFVR